MAEHNGNYSTAKNIFDWCTRINAKVFKKSQCFASQSPGARGEQVY
jgi:NAD(P)H-dependent FMN reductase